ncbi:MAG: metallophosphoesterase [Phycisphaerales bacterium JB037]
MSQGASGGGSWLSPRRPDLPFPLEHYEIAHPAVPPTLDGLRILHLTDFHVRRSQGRHSTLGRLGAVLDRFEFDLIALTGDYMDAPGEEQAAARELERLAARWRTRFGAFGIFGNHDTGAFIDRARTIPGIRWLENESAGVPGLPLRLLGAGFPEDVLAAAWRDVTAGESQAGEFTLALIHYPTELHACAAVGVPIVLCGHTHGGQIRLSPTFAPHTSSDLPAHLASGVLRLGDTLGVISRGLGEGVVPVRVNCPPQAPVITLRRGPIAGGAATEALRMVRAW